MTVETLPAITPYACARCRNFITLRGACAWCGYKPLPAPYGTKYPEPAYTAYCEGLALQEQLMAGR